jgi:hypothetical protein
MLSTKFAAKGFRQSQAIRQHPLIQYQENVIDLLVKKMASINC